MVVCPATVNTVNKWAAGITDTLALGLLVEGQGKGVPVVVVPFTNAAMAGHPAFQTGLQRLREWGATVLFGDHVYPLHPPGTGERHLHAFPWRRRWRPCRTGPGPPRPPDPTDGRGRGRRCAPVS